MLELAEVTLGHIAHVQKTENNADLLLEVLCSKDTKQKKFLQSFREAASRVDLNRSAICENVSYTTESMSKSFDDEPGKPSTAKRRRFQTFKKVHHEKWFLATTDKKGDTCVNSEVHSSVMK